MTTAPTPQDVAAAEREGYVIAPDMGPDDTEPRYLVKVRGAVVQQGMTHSDAAALAVDRWRQDVERRDTWQAQATQANHDRGQRAAAAARMQAAADEVNAQYAGHDVDRIDVHDGRYWFAGRSYLSLDAVHAVLLVETRRIEAVTRFKRDYEQAITDAGLTVRLTEDDQIDRARNHREPWLDQVVDVLVPLGHPMIPTRGRVEINDGMALLDTLAVDDLVQSLGISLPETVDAKADRRAALREVRERARRHAEDQAQEAKRAADVAAELAAGFAG